MLLLAFSLPMAWAFATDSDYRYSYQGEDIRLTPSRRWIAVADREGLAKRVEGEFTLMRDALSDHASMAHAGLDLCVLKSAPGARAKAKGSVTGDPMAAIRRQARDLGIQVQPVFEQGGAMLIPFNEVTVGFNSPTDAAVVDHPRAPQGHLHHRDR